jgi:hypothetical protein
MNKQIWNLYKTSERGKKAIELFTIKDEDNLEEKIVSIFCVNKEYLGNYIDEELFLDDFYLILLNVYLIENELRKAEPVTNNFEFLIDNFELYLLEEKDNEEIVKIKGKKPIIKKKDYKGICGFLSELSLFLYYAYPDLFIPNLFSERFDILLKILDVLEIPLPPLPVKTDKRGRLLFYNDLNNEILKFAKENQLTPEETCACIYDYSFLLIEENVKETELPEPTNIWFTGGAKEDYEPYLKTPKQNANTIWTCNENTKRGDIVVMYVCAPYSCIQSIWRAEIDGFYTPLNYHNSRTIINNGIVVPSILLKDLKSDSYFSQLPIVRKNLQGLNGVKFSAKDYQELQRLLTAKSFDVSVLPKLYSPDLEMVKDLKNEKDVEEKLLIPLLQKLGYTGNDWTRQLSQKAGRKEKAIPDFVFLPKGDIHFQNAPMIIEAKFDMNSNLERTKTYNQALSYARMMSSGIFGICDKERIIIYKSKNGYFDRFNPTFEKHWQSLNDAETFSKLKKLIGKELIERLWQLSKKHNNNFTI